MTAALEQLVMAAVSLGLLVAILVPLERAFPARRQSVLRPAFAVDLAFFFGQHLLFAGLSAFLVTRAAAALGAPAVAPLSDAVRAWPVAAQAALAVVLGDLCAYWYHRAQHRVELLWRIHAVHHSATDLDWLAAHREHPLDGLTTQFAVNLPALLLGLRVDLFLGLVAFRALMAIFVHANVRLPLGPLRWVIGAPELHRAHHARERDPGNYANLAPYLDWLFGTHRPPLSDSAPLGVEPPLPDGYLALLAAPFLPQTASGAAAPAPAASVSGADRCAPRAPR